MNSFQRADSIRAILSDFKKAAGLEVEPDAEVIGDLLCNLKHYCDEEEVDFDLAMHRAEINYDAEVVNRQDKRGEPEPLKLWTVMYHHGSGTTVDLVRCAHKPTPEEALAALPHIEQAEAGAGEYLEIEEYAETAIATIGD